MAVSTEYVYVKYLEFPFDVSSICTLNKELYMCYFAHHMTYDYM